MLVANKLCNKCNTIKDIDSFCYNKRSKDSLDYNKENCSKDNLITTCLLCNIKANSNSDYWYAYYAYIMDKT